MCYFAVLHNKNIDTGIDDLIQNFEDGKEKEAKNIKKLLKKDRTITSITVQDLEHD